MLQNSWFCVWKQLCKFYLIFLNKQLTRFFSDRYQDVWLFQRSNISTSLLKSANVKLCWLMFWPIYIHSDIFVISCHTILTEQLYIWFLSFSSHSKKTNTFSKILSHHLSFFFCLLRVLKIFTVLIYCDVNKQVIVFHRKFLCWDYIFVKVILLHRKWAWIKD